MLMALSLASVLFFAGQTSTQSAQPVQSSAATCSVNFMPLNSGTRASVLLKVAGAPFSAAGVVNFRADASRAGRSPRTSRIGCRSSRPTPGFPARDCASRIAPCRSGTCRPRERADRQVFAFAGRQIRRARPATNLRRVRRQSAAAARRVPFTWSGTGTSCRCPACCPRP